MAETIRVTVEVPALTKAQLEFLARVATTRLPGIHRDEGAGFFMVMDRSTAAMRGLIDRGLIRENGDFLTLLPAGRAVLEHYEAQR